MAWDSGLEKAFHPRAVALVGASSDPKRGSQAWRGATTFLRFLQRLEFPGQLYPINPRATEILGLKAYPSVKALPETPDLVIVSVPAPEVPPVLEDCAVAGAKNVHIFTSGFSETGDTEGRALEERVKQIALKGGLRLIGPNCMGFHVPVARLSTWDSTPREPGPVAFLSQSGGHATEFTRYAPSFGIRFSKVISFGNALLLDSTDFLEYLAQDPETRIIGMYLEGVKDGRKLFQLVQEINRQKPIILWKGGLTEPGGRAASSHTGSLAGEEAIWEAFFRQTGAVRVNSLDEMADVVVTFLLARPATGRRVAIVGVGGGNSVWSADACARDGLEVPTFMAETLKELRSFIAPAGNIIRNPIDAGEALSDVMLLERTLRLVARDPLIDMIILTEEIEPFLHRNGSQIEKLSEVLCGLAEEFPQKPLGVILHSYSGEASRAPRDQLTAALTKAGVPIYRNLPRASRGLAKFTRYHTFMSQPRGL